MYSHAIILAVLSAGALAQDTANVFLTAFAPADVNCTEATVGNNVTFAVPVPGVSAVTNSSCIGYAPELGQNIEIDYFGSANASFWLSAYSDSNCHIRTAHANLIKGTDLCIPMIPENEQTQTGAHYFNERAAWQSVMIIALGPESY